MERSSTRHGAYWFGALLAGMVLVGSGTLLAQTIGLTGTTMTLLHRDEWGFGTEEWLGCGPNISVYTERFRLGFVAVWKSTRVR
jgi:hypothetical protein